MPPDSVDSSFPNRLPFQECEFTGIEEKKLSLQLRLASIVIYENNAAPLA